MGLLDGYTRSEAVEVAAAIVRMLDGETTAPVRKAAQLAIATLPLVTGTSERAAFARLTEPEGAPSTSEFPPDLASRAGAIWLAYAGSHADLGRQRDAIDRLASETDDVVVAALQGRFDALEHPPG
jgi:hypothetical protein